MKLKILAPAKINLNINIFPKKLKNGLFPVKMLMSQLELSDEIILEEKEDGLEVKCFNNQVPKGKENLVFQAAKILKEKFKIKKGIKIILKKKIPIKAGLGGGSSDAAATILGLKKIWNLQLTKEELINLASKIGKDVCYSVLGGTALITNVQENVKKLPFLMPKLPVIVITPFFTKPSTAWAYQNLDLKRIGKNEKKLDRLISAIQERNLKKIGQNLHNDFEYSIGKKFPEILKIKKALLKNEAEGAILAGAGLSVFGIYEDKKKAKNAFEKLKDQYSQYQVFLTRIC